MGKIRVKTLGLEELEDKQKEKVKEKKEQKKARKTAHLDPARLAKGAHGGERVVAVGPSEEEIQKLAITEITEKISEKTVVAKKRARSRKYQVVAQLIDKNKVYPLNQALELLPRLKLSNFDETVELHINTSENGISGTLTLPHGTGKKTKVAIADPSAGSGQAQLDELLKKIEKGKVDFDVLIATPDAMPKLVKVAKVLGPRGLMPSPKNGTITQNPQEAVKKYEAGQIRFKTESKAPIIHLSVGKLSTGSEKLAENIKAVFNAIQASKIKKAVLKSTMSPGIKIDFSIL